MLELHHRARATADLSFGLGIIQGETPGLSGLSHGLVKHFIEFPLADNCLGDRTVVPRISQRAKRTSEK